MSKEENMVENVIELASTCEGFDFEALEKAIPLAKIRMKELLEFDAKKDELEKTIGEMLESFIKQTGCKFYRCTHSDGKTIIYANL